MNATEEDYTIIEEIMQGLINDGTRGFAEAMAKMYNLAMKFEREGFLGAARYERTPERSGYANGFKPRSLKTPCGELQLRIPQVRGSERAFYPKSLERGTRSDRAVRMAIAEMYVKGVSTRQVSAVFEQLCDMDITADQVSLATRELDEELEKWRNRPIEEIKILYADATYQKVRMDGVAVNLATFIVTGVGSDGKRTILAVDSANSEDEVHWRHVFENLKKRGMRGVKLVVSDAHSGLRAALNATLSGVAWQRCQMHLQRNAQAFVSRRSQREEVASKIRTIFNAPSASEARRLLDITVEEYSKSQPKLAAWMEQNIPDGLTIYSFPERIWIKARTNNLEERLNKQIKARTRLIPVFPNQASQLRLVSAICMEISDEWEASKQFLDVTDL